MGTEDKNNTAAELVIIGGGPAGIQASRMVKTARPDWRVVVIRPEDYSVVYCALPYAIEGLFPLKRVLKKDALVTDTGSELVRGSVTTVDTDSQAVNLDDGRSLRYQRLLIVTGATPVVPPVKGMDLENVFTVKTEGDARRIMARLALDAGCESGLPPTQTAEKRQTAVVVGSGAIGVEQAVAYVAHGLEVHVVEMQNSILPNLLDEDMAAPLAEELVGMGIHLHLGSALEEIREDCIVLSGDETISMDPDRDFVVVAVGMKPDIDFLSPGTFERGTDGLLVDEHMRTGVANVWAAGDCVAGKSAIDGKPLGGKLATNAVPMAKVVALDILGKEASYPGFYNGAVTVVGKKRAGGTGFTMSAARRRGFEVFATRAGTTARFPMMPEAGDIQIKLVFEVGSKRLLGGQVVGTEAVAERIDLLTFAIQNGSTADDLSKLSYSAQPWQTFLPARNAIVEAASQAL